MNGSHKAWSVGLAFAAAVALSVPVVAAEAGAADTSREARLEAARARLEQAAREVAELSLDENGPRNVFRYRTQGTPRAALGINIGSPDRRDAAAADGVPVISVSPGGPAADAGLRAGDVLVSVGGRELKRENGRSPQGVLLDYMEGVEPGANVVVEYRRDGKLDRATVVAEAMGPTTLGLRALPLPGSFGVPGLEGLFRGAGVFGDLELVTLTPKLGQYFGTDRGLLVIRAPADSRLALEEGDVIVDIAGRVPTSPAHAMRILDSYQPGERLSINLLRLKKRMTVDVEVPADTRRGRVPRPDVRPGDPPAVVLPAPAAVRGRPDPA